MPQLTVSDKFISIIVSDPSAALRFQFWAEDHLHLRGTMLTIFVDEPEFPLEFWSRLLL